MLLLQMFSIKKRMQVLCKSQEDCLIYRRGYNRFGSCGKATASVCISESLQCKVKEIC